MAPELPCADKTAACTAASRLAGSILGTACTMPVMVSLRFDPVSASATGKTFIAFKASAESVMTLAARRSQPS